MRSDPIGSLLRTMRVLVSIFALTRKSLGRNKVLSRAELTAIDGSMEGKPRRVSPYLQVTSYVRFRVD